jgi:hypothetical protein
MSTHVFLTAAGLLAVCSIANGGDPPKSDPDVAKLVKDLGSPRFAVRENAEQKLVALGSKARAAVQAGTKDADPEVARRCGAILPKVRAAEREAFVAEKHDWPAPAGMKFKEIVGDTTEARKLFALMTDDDHRANLADQAAADPEEAAKLYASRVARLADLEKDAVARFEGRLFPVGADVLMRDASRAAVGPGETALVLFLGSLPRAAGAADPPEVERVLVAGFADLVRGRQRVPARKLFAAWLDRRTGPAAIQSGLEAALYAGVAEAVPVARRLAADPKAPGAVAGTAALVLGHHGARADLSRLSALREDGRAYLVLSGLPGEPDLELQVREVAAAMSLMLRGQDPGAHGFDQTRHSTWWAGPGPAGFTTPNPFELAEARAAALTKAWEWLDKQPDAAPAPKK